MRKRLISIQAIRAIAFVLVYLSHAELASTGPAGVSLFLVLSGFCMTYAYLDAPEKIPVPSLVNNLRFAWTKVRKLYALHIITMLMVALMVFAGLILNRADGVEIAGQCGYLTANALLLQSWIPWRDGYYSFNAVSWYLSTIMFCYFLFPSLFRIIQSKDRKRITGLGCITLVLMVCFTLVLDLSRRYLGGSSDFIKWATYIAPFSRVGDFIIGLCVGYLFLTIRRVRTNWLCTLGEATVFVVLAIQVILYTNRSDAASIWMFTLFWLPMSAAFIYLFAAERGALSRVLSRSRALVWIGNISGEAFLIHHICIKAAGMAMHNKFIIAAVAFMLTLASVTAWRFISGAVVKAMKR